MNVADDEEVVEDGGGEFWAARRELFGIEAIVEGIIREGGDRALMPLGIGREGVYIPLAMAEPGIRTDRDSRKNNGNDSGNL